MDAPTAQGMCYSPYMVEGLSELYRILSTNYGQQPGFFELIIADRYEDKSLLSLFTSYCSCNISSLPNATSLHTSRQLR